MYGFTDTSSGAQMPAWTRQTLVIDATGTVIGGSGVDSNGMPQPHLGTLTLAADGAVTLAGDLAANVLFQELRMDEGRTLVGGVLNIDQGGTTFERLVLAVRSGSAHPEILTPIPGSVLPGPDATWEWTDNGVLVTDWQLKIGTNPGSANINDSGILPAATRSLAVTGLPTAGQTVFVRLLYREGGVWMMSDVQYTAFGVPPPPGSGGTSAPDLSLWGLMAMVFGILSVLAIDTRRRAIGNSSGSLPARVNIIHVACGLAGVVGLLLLPDIFPELQVLLEPALALLTQTVEHLVALTGVPITRAGTVLAHPDGFGYRIDYLCAGIQPAALMAATLLLVRATWTQRAIGILVALVGVELFNIARLVHLYLLGVHWPEAFDLAHQILWNVAAMVAGLVYLGVWLFLTDRRVSSDLDAHRDARQEGIILI